MAYNALSLNLLEKHTKNNTMQIPNSHIQNNSGNHPVGDYSATVKRIEGNLTDNNGYEIKVTFSTQVGTITQFWNTRTTGWKIEIFRDALGMAGDFDTDEAEGKTLDLHVTHKVSEKTKKTYVNVETHPSGSLVDVGVPAPPTVADVSKEDVPF